MENACRMCACSTENGANLLDADRQGLAKWCAKNLELQLHEGDLPTRVCEKCVKQIEEWILFKSKASQAKKRFIGELSGDTLMPALASTGPTPGSSLSLVDNFISGVDWIPGFNSSTPPVKSKTIDILRQVRIRTAPFHKEPQANISHTVTEISDNDEENIDDPEAIVIEDSEEERESSTEEVSLTDKYNLKEFTIVLNKLSSSDIEKFSKKKTVTRRVHFADIDESDSEVFETVDETKSKREKTRPSIELQPTTHRSTRRSLRNESMEIKQESQSILTVPEFVPVEYKEENKNLEAIAANIEAVLEKDEEEELTPRTSMQDLCSALNEGLTQKVQQRRRSRVSGLRRKKSIEESQRIATEVPSVPIVEPSVTLPSPTEPIHAHNLAALLKNLPKHKEYTVIPAELDGETVFYIKFKSNNLDILQSEEAQNGTNIPSTSSNHDISPTSSMEVVEDQPKISSPLEHVENLPKSPEKSLNLSEPSTLMSSPHDVDDLVVPMDDTPSLVTETQNIEEFIEVSLELPSAGETLSETSKTPDSQESQDNTPSNLSDTLLHSTTSLDGSQETDGALGTSDSQELLEPSPDIPSSLGEGITTVDIPLETDDTQESLDLQHPIEEEEDVLASLPQIVESGDLSALTPEAMKHLGLTLEGSIPPRGTKYIPPSPPTLVCKTIQDTPIVSSIVSNTPSALKSIISTKCPNINKRKTVDVSKSKKDVDIRRSSGRVAAKKARDKFAKSLDSEDDPDDPDVVFKSGEDESDSECETSNNKITTLKASTPRKNDQEKIIEEVDLTISSAQRVVLSPSKNILEKEEESSSPEVNLSNISVSTLFQAQVTVLSNGVLDSNKITLDTTEVPIITSLESPLVTVVDNNKTNLETEVINLEDTNTTKHPSICSVCQQSILDVDSHLCLQSSRNKKQPSLSCDLDDVIAKTCCVVCHKLVPSSQLSKHSCFLGQPSNNERELVSNNDTPKRDVTDENKNIEVPSDKFTDNSSSLSIETSSNLPSNENGKCPVMSQINVESDIGPNLNLDIASDLPSEMLISDTTNDSVENTERSSENVNMLSNEEKNKNGLDNNPETLVSGTLSDHNQQPSTENLGEIPESNLQNVDEVNDSVTEKEESFTKLPEDLATFVLEHETSPKTNVVVNLTESLLNPQENLVSVNVIPAPESVNMDVLTDEALLKFSVPDNNPEIPDVPEIDTSFLEDTVTSVDLQDQCNSDENTEEQPNLTCSKCNAKFEDTKSFVNHYAKHSYAATATRHKKKKIKKPVKKTRKVRTSTPEQPEDVLDESFIQNLIEVNVPRADDVTLQQVAMNASVDKLYDDLQKSEKQEPRKSLRVKSAKKVVKTVKRKSLTSIKYECAFCNKSYVQKSRIESHISSHLSNLNNLPENANIETIIESIKTPKSIEKSRKSNRVKKITKKMKELKKKKEKIVRYTKGEYKCNFCGKNYSQRLRMENHILDHLNEDTYMCEICNEEFTTFHHFNAHQITHIKPFSCSICTKRFKSKTGKKLHESEQHKNQCIKCKLQFKSEKEYKSHYLKSHDIVKCPHCNEPFKTNDELNLHIKKEHKNITYNCHLCNYIANNKSIINLHIENHDIKDFKIKMKQRLLKSEHPCVYCELDFNTEYNLREHSNTVHSIEYPFSCDYCSFRCKTEKIIQKHLNVHEDYACPKCPQRFKMLPKLTEHIKTHGINDVTVTKENLNILFSMPGTSKSNNYTPIRDSKSTKQKCDICKHVFSSEEILDHTCFGENDNDNSILTPIEITEEAFSTESLVDVEATFSTPKTRSASKGDNSNRKRQSSVTDTEEQQVLKEESSGRKRRSSSVSETKEPELLETTKEIRKNGNINEALRRKKEVLRMRMENLAKARELKSLKIEASKEQEQLNEKSKTKKMKQLKEDTPSTETPTEVTQSIQAEMTDSKNITNEKTSEEPRTLRKRKTEDIESKPKADKKIKKQVQKSTTQMKSEESSVVDTVFETSEVTENGKNLQALPNLNNLRSSLMRSLNAEKDKTESQIDEKSKNSNNSPDKSESKSERVLRNKEDKKPDVKSASPDKKSVQENISVRKKLCFTNEEENLRENSDSMKSPKKSKPIENLAQQPSLKEVKGAAEKTLRSQRKKSNVETELEDKSETSSLSPTKSDDAKKNKESVETTEITSPKKIESQSEASGRVLRGQKLQESPKKEDTSVVLKSSKLSKKQDLKSTVEEEENGVLPSPKKSKHSVNPTKPEAVGESEKNVNKRSVSLVLENSELDVLPSPKKLKTLKTKTAISKKQTEISELKNSEIGVMPSPKKSESGEINQGSETNVVESGKVKKKKQPAKLEKSDGEVVPSPKKAKISVSEKVLETVVVESGKVKSKKRPVKLGKLESDTLPSPKKSKNTEGLTKPGKVISKKQTANTEPKNSESQDLENPTLRSTRRTESPKKAKAEKSKIKDNNQASLDIKKQCPKKTKMSPKKKEDNLCKFCNEELLSDHVCVKQCDRCKKMFASVDIETHRCMRVQSTQKTCLKCKQHMHSLDGTHICNKKENKT